MEKIKNVPLKKAFIYVVCGAAILITALSGLTIYGCYRLQKMILPVSNEAILTIVSTNSSGEKSEQQQRFEFGKETSIPMGFAVGIDYDKEPSPEKYAIAEENLAVEFTVDRIDNNFTLLSPKRQLAYTTLSAAKIVLPLIYAIVGILLCAAWFYKEKLQKPIQILMEASENIAHENLDFSLSCGNRDELGILCDSFETMRQALVEKHRELWNMVNERQRLMASVAHDLRNPISIMEGYLEYLHTHIPKQDLSREDMMSMVEQTSEAAARLKRYTDSLQDIYRIEEQDLHKTVVLLPELLNDMTDSFELLAEKKQIQITVTNSVPACRVKLDGQIFYRISENIFVNALRFARTQIQMNFSLENNIVTVQITDDGPGFPESILRQNSFVPTTTDKTGKHIGLGLVISSVLCRKHGGSLKLENRDGSGACAVIQIFADKF